MRWKSEYHPDWQRKFALFPVTLTDLTVIWLEYYWKRYLKDDPKSENGFSCGSWENVKERPINSPNSFQTWLDERKKVLKEYKESLDDAVAILNHEGHEDLVFKLNKLRKEL